MNNSCRGIARFGSVKNFSARICVLTSNADPPSLKWSDPKYVAKHQT